MPFTVRMEDFDSIHDEWEEILPYCWTNTVFVTPTWQRVWWQHFGGNAELHILSIRDDDELIGIAPLMVKDDTLSFLGDTDLFDYHDFLAVRGRESEFYNALCNHIVDMDWNTLYLGSLLEGTPTLEYLSTLANRKGMSVETTEEDRSPITLLPSTWDEYLSTLRKKDRHELRRKLRRLDGVNTARQYQCAEADVTCCMTDFFQLLRASSHDKDKFLTIEREDFFRDIASEFAERDQFKLFFLEVDNIRVASCICFDYAGSYLLYNSGYDPEYSALSVGLLNKALSLKEAIEEGKQSFDFLRGTERYKYNLGAKDQIVYQMVIRR